MLPGFQRTTLYLSIKLHARARDRAYQTGTSMSKLIERWAWEGIVRDELAEAAAGVEPSPGALDAIQARIDEGGAPTSPAAPPS